MPPSPHSQHYLQHGIRKEKLCFYFFLFLLKTFPLWWIVSTIKTLVLSLRALLCWVWWTARPNIYGACVRVCAHVLRWWWWRSSVSILLNHDFPQLIQAGGGGEKIPEKRLIFIGVFFLFNVSRNFLFHAGWSVWDLRVCIAAGEVECVLFRSRSVGNEVAVKIACSHLSYYYCYCFFWSLENGEKMLPPILLLCALAKFPLSKKWSGTEWSLTLSFAPRIFWSWFSSALKRVLAERKRQEETNR